MDSNQPVVTQMDDKKNHFSAKMVLTVTAISMGSVAYSYAGAIIGSTLGQPTFTSYMGLDTNPHAESLTAAGVRLFYIGGILGTLLNAWMADAYGRKRTAFVGAVVLLISTACLAGSVNITMFIVFRLLVGVG